MPWIALSLIGVAVAQGTVAVQIERIGDGQALIRDALALSRHIHLGVFAHGKGGRRDRGERGDDTGQDHGLDVRRHE